jgi:phage FluMu protein Com
MPITLRCTGCCVMKLRDDLAGKKVRCPRCKAVLIVPEPDEELVETATRKEPVQNVRRKTGHTGRVQREEPVASRQNKLRVGRDKDKELDVPKPKAGKPGKFKPCPRCGAEGATRVKWTSWGSFYGPRLFTHVRCPECGYCYNGKSGRSNALPAAVFVAVPLLGILGILGGIVYVLFQRGYASF